MPAPIVVTIDPSQIRIQADQQAAAAIVIRNRTEEVEHYVLRVENLPAGWAEAIPDQVSAFPLQETRSQLLVHPPPGAPGATYTAIVRVTSQQRAGTEGWASLELTVLAAAVPPTSEPAAPGAPVKETVPVASPLPPVETRGEALPTARPPVPSERRVEPRPITAAQIQVRTEPVANPSLRPPAVQWRLALQNAGNVLDTFSFSFVGLQPEWVSVEPTQVTLKPEEQAAALLTIHPGAHTPAGTYPFTLRVFSQLNLSQRTEVPLRVEVRAYAAFVLTCSPPEAEAQGPREFAISLVSDQDSNADLSVDLSAGDPAEACEYTFDPAQLMLPARQSIKSTLHVRPRTPLGPNERRTVIFKVTATPRGGLAPAQSAEARLTQLGIPPPILELRPQVGEGELQADYTLLVRNPATVGAVLHLAASDPEAGCECRFDPPRLTVPPRGQAQARLTVRARAYAETEKPFALALSATREGELVPVARAEGRFVQKPVKPVALSLTPPQQSQIGRARYYVKAVNPRAQPVQVWLEGRDDFDALSFDFSPHEVQLSPGAEGGAWLTARPKDRLLQGEQRRVHRFTVSGQIEGVAEPLMVQGTLAQVRGFEWGGIGKVLIRIVRWVVALVLILFIAALALAGLEALTWIAPEAGEKLYGVLDNPLVRFIMASPVSAPARTIVRWVYELIMVLRG